MGSGRATFGLGAVFAVLTVVSPPVSAQPKFAVEVEGGRNGGLTPYLQNVVYTDSDIRGQTAPSSGSFEPFLVDERSGWGTVLDARFVSENLQAGLSVRWFDVSKARVHHRGTAPGRPDGELRRSRIRTNDTVDDSGVEYQEMDPSVDIPIGADRRANLFVFALEGGYRFYLYTGDFDVFAPVVGSVVATYLSRKFAPVRPGLGLESGLSVAFDFVSLMQVIVGGRFHAFATPTYWNRGDAARRAAQLDQTTESALLSTQLSGSLNVGLQFAIR